MACFYVQALNSHVKFEGDQKKTKEELANADLDFLPKSNIKDRNKVEWIANRFVADNLDTFFKVHGLFLTKTNFEVSF